jgi:hypothetical protein
MRLDFEREMMMEIGREIGTARVTGTTKVTRRRWATG